jgi:hypothetical protein
MGRPNDPDAIEAALDELYRVDPAQFVETRKRLAADLRGAGEKDAAKALLAARRPTVAAWALNQLSRRRPEIVAELLARSRELEAAQVGALTGSREGMRDATRAQRRALADATEAALAALGDRATDGFRTQILSTLHAAAADEEVGELLRRGRLVREVSGPSGFPDGPNLTLVPDLDRPVAPAPSKAKKAPPPASAPSGAVANETAAVAQRPRVEREQERERAALELAQRRIAEADAAAAAAQEAAVVAEAAAVEARRRVVQLHEDLEGARRDARSADEAAARTRREWTRLTRAATRLRSRGSPAGT